MSGEDNPSKIFANMVLGRPRKKVAFQLDYGATVNVLPVDVYKKLFVDPECTQLEPSSVTLIMYDRSEVEPVGKRVVQVSNPKTHRTYRVEFQVIKGPVVPILGSRAIQYMKLITVNVHNFQRTSSVYTDNSVDVVDKDSLLSEFADVFEGLGKLPRKLHLEVELDVVIASFDEYFGQKKRLRQICLEFNRLKQQDGKRC